MTRATLLVTPEHRGGVSVLHLSGRLVLEDGDAVFRDLVVDLGDVTSIDSAGIGVLVGRFLSVRRRGGDMKLANLTSRSHRVMTITQLLDVFDCFDSIDEAVGSFAIAHP
jgi:anti-sigma B factor antagonist